MNINYIQILTKLQEDNLIDDFRKFINVEGLKTKYKIFGKTEDQMNFLSAYLNPLDNRHFYTIIKIVAYCHQLLKEINSFEKYDESLYEIEKYFNRKTSLQVESEQNA